MKLATILGACATVLAVSTHAVTAQEFALTSAEVADSAALAGSMPRLAAEVLAVYQDSNRVRFLDRRFRLELLTGQYDAATATLAELRRVRRDTTPAARSRNVQYEIHSTARQRSARDGRPFADTFAESFRERFATLDDATAAFAARAILLSPRTVASDLRWATPNQEGRTTVSLEEALTLLHVYAAVEAYRGFAGLPADLVAEDDRRRYLIETNVAVPTPDGATLCAIVVRPRAATGPIPSLLQFTIYADSIGSFRDALLSAAHGYAGITGHVRGKACSPDRIVPYVHDGRDVTALIEWIAKQPWSDGRVGMHGGSYSGYTAWAAARHMPGPLKAIMVGAPVAPGIDVPMEGNVAWNFVYPWPFYTTNNRWLDNATYNDTQRWNRLYDSWYRTGRPYRELDQVDGTPNPVFDEWLAHPGVDEYWRAMIPQGKDYARISIPVLQTAGYYFGGPGGALYYFLEHYRHNPAAHHYLVIGPWDHLQAQRGVVTALGDTATWFAGYEIDPVAQVDILADLRFQWFDHVLKGAPRPSMLRDRLNYQVMGADRWDAGPPDMLMSAPALRLYFDSARQDGRYRLRDTPGRADAVITQTVDLADRSDADARGAGGILAPVIDTANAIVLMSEPLEQPLEITGLLAGQLELVTNKRDFDFVVTPYELTAEGQYVQLPPYTSRASHVGSLGERRLLRPGRPEKLAFVTGLRMVSRRVAAGSRLVVVLAVVKNPRQQVNYGTGRAVSDESLADAGDPLSIRWSGQSWIAFPRRR